MKKLLLAFLTLTISLTASATSTPVCDIADETGGFPVPPCMFDEHSTNVLIIDMMLANKEGVIKVLTSGVSGLQLGSFDTDTATVTFVSETIGEPTNGGTMDYHSVVNYELKLDDCRGTDQCSGTYLWTVIAETTGDGFMSKTTFTNELKLN